MKQILAKIGNTTTIITMPGLICVVFAIKQED